MWSSTWFVQRKLTPFNLTDDIIFIFKLSKFFINIVQRFSGIIIPPSTKHSTSSMQKIQKDNLVIEILLLISTISLFKVWSVIKLAHIKPNMFEIISSLLSGSISELYKNEKISKYNLFFYILIICFTSMIFICIISGKLNYRGLALSFFYSVLASMFCSLAVILYEFFFKKNEINF